MFDEAIYFIVNCDTNVCGFSIDMPFQLQQVAPINLLGPKGNLNPSNLASPLGLSKKVHSDNPKTINAAIYGSRAKPDSRIWQRQLINRDFSDSL